MSRYISDVLRQKVMVRADFRCEYCRMHDRHSFFTFHIEHIISLKHGGKSVLQNLAYACPVCNINKGTDIATVLDDILHPIRFFNPRIDIWAEHFAVEGTGLMTASTSIGEATVKIFDFNHPDSIIERLEMLKKGIF